MFSLYYKKNNNHNIFEYLEKNDFKSIQNYFPLLSNFFNLDETNYNKINLNQKYSIKEIKDRINNNNFSLICEDDNQKIKKLNSFFKFSPLIDPVKYMVGKYENIERKRIEQLPKLNGIGLIEKYKDKNNAAYVDSFFSYLTSKLLHDCNFNHGIDFYGTFTAIQNKYICNIVDDLEYLYDSKYFHNNKEKLFDVDQIDEERFFENDTRKYKKNIMIENDKVELKCDDIDNSLFDDIFKLTEENVSKHNEETCEQNEIWKDTNNKKSNAGSFKKTNSTCSSRSSNTDNEDEELGTSDEESDFSDYSSSNSEEEIQSYIYNFPVQIICLEKMEHTLDYLMETKGMYLSTREWKSCLFQIIMTLISYQKVFDFTHNDLHTNNIMWNKTDKKFINYKFNGSYYRVPTFGKIYKIIDFGRSIYKFQDKIICSDSYHPKGDAATQYNCEPYFNQNKPRLNPNKSFDLCRLACSLYDYFMDEEEDEEKIEDPVAKLIDEWVKDDKGRNILYKNNGEERYPDFKLYKMIARTVHNHTPEAAMNHIIFSSYRVGKKKVKKQKIINIDAMEPMFN